ncbi:MAG: ROK family protein [Rhodobacteraceae bacterium]|nr:ROK family protein [Paracoccaceae bacterium]
MTRDATRPVLVSDVGGTNTRIALVDGDGRQMAVRRYANDSFSSYYDALSRFLVEHPETTGLAGACVAVAGPVTSDEAQLTNRNWHFSLGDIAARLDDVLPNGFDGSVRLLNDLAALGHALPHLGHDGLEEVKPAATDPANDQALVVGLGTGFNVAFVKLRLRGTVVAEAELGHAGLPASVDRLLRDRLGAKADAFFSIEELFSGRGLAALSAAMTGTARDGAHLILDYDSDADARAVVDFMAQLMGTLCHEFVYYYMPFRGICFAGSVARGVLSTPARAAFMQAFDRPGMFEGHIAQIAVRIITDDTAALLGTESFLRRELALS